MASAGLISALASAPTTVLAGLFGATGVVPGVVGDFQNIFLFAEAGDSLYPQINTAMSQFRSKFSIGNGKFSPNRLTADLRVRQHAAICSLPFLHHVVTSGVKELVIAIDSPVPPPVAGQAAPPQGGTTTFGEIVLK